MVIPRVPRKITSSNTQLLCVVIINSCTRSPLPGLKPRHDVHGIQHEAAQVVEGVGGPLRNVSQAIYGPHGQRENKWGGRATILSSVVGVCTASGKVSTARRNGNCCVCCVSMGGKKGVLSRTHTKNTPGCTFGMRDRCT